MAASIPQKMKALLKEAEGPSYSYVEIPVPEPGDGEVLIKVDAVALCGSDIALYNWDNIARFGFSKLLYRYSPVIADIDVHQFHCLS